MATPPEFSLFEWFFTVDHKVKPGIEARAEKPNLAGRNSVWSVFKFKCSVSLSNLKFFLGLEITYSCLDDQHTPQFLVRTHFNYLFFVLIVSKFYYRKKQ